MYKSIWFKMGSQLLNPWKGVLLLTVVVGCMVPVMLHFPKMERSIDFDLMLPASSESLETFTKMGEAFSLGTLSPYKLLFDGTQTNTTVNSNEAFAAMISVVTSFSSLDATPSLASFSGISCLGGQNITYLQYQAAVNCGINCDVDNHSDKSVYLRTIAALALEFNNDEFDATYVSVVLDVDPFSRQGTDWLVQARRRLDDVKHVAEAVGFSVYLLDGAGAEYDADQSVYAVVPLMIGVTMAIVFVLMGLFFKSIVVPLRSVLTICLTLAWVYGLSVLVYQEGAFAGLGLNCVSKTDQISWLPPVMTFSIIVGLGLDYEVFIISRILEFREEGLTDNSAVLKGLYKRGGIITAAGVIMAVAFSGLLLSGELLLNQTAFMLVMAVLTDTFVIRTVLVPILMGLTGTKSWWPRNLPQANIDLER